MTGEKVMTHEAGIEAAVQRFYGDASYPLKSHILNDMADAIQAYLSASGMVLVPREATDEMKFHTLVAGYVAAGATGEEASVLAKDKMAKDGYAAFSDVQYAAMLAAAPDPFKSQP